MANYIHIAYADNASGTLNFNLVSGDFLGEYVSTDPIASTDPTRYVWNQIKGDTGTTGGTGPEGAKGINGIQGIRGDDGSVAVAGSVTDNGNGTVTVYGGDGSSITFLKGLDGAKGNDGNTPTIGVDYFDGTTGDFVSFVYTRVLKGSAVPTITAGTGSYNGFVEVMPTGDAVWQDDPTSAFGDTTYMSSNRYRHVSGAVWELTTPNWTPPVVFIETLVTNPQSQLKAYAFKRSSSVLSTPPTGGSYANPTPTAWSDGIPVGTSPIYMVNATFTSDGLSPQNSGSPVVWSTPVLFNEKGTSVRHQFGATQSGPWSYTPSSGDEWMIVCTEGSDGVFVCDFGNPIRIKGETGIDAQSSLFAYAFKRSISSSFVETPTGGSYASPVPVDSVVFGWRGTIPAGTGVLYTSTRVFTSDGLSPQGSAWSESRAFSDTSHAIQLTASEYAITYDTNGENPTPATITLTANAAGVADGYFKFDGDTAIVPTESTFTDGATALTDTAVINSPATYSASPITVRAALADGDQEELAYDALSIVNLKTGSSGYTFSITNGSHTLPVNDLGDTVYTGSGTDIAIFSGANELNSVASAPGLGQFSVSVGTGVNITANPAVDITGLPFIIGDHSAMTDTFGGIDYTIDVEGLITIVLSQTFALGVAGLDGLTPNTCALTVSSAVIRYAKDGSETDSILMDAVATGVADPYFEYVSDVSGIIRPKDLASAYTLANGEEPLVGGQRLITVNVYDGLVDPTIQCTDFISIYAIQDGADAITVTMRNPTASLAADDNGIPVNYVNTGNEIRVYEGANLIPYDGEGTVVTNGSWRLLSKSGNVDIGVGVATDSGDYLTMADITSFTAGEATGYITYVINGKQFDGTPFSRTFDQSFTKLNFGANGTGTAGVTVKSASGFLYYQTAVTGAAPTILPAFNKSATEPFNFLSGAFAVTTNSVDWKQTPLSMGQTTSNYYYVQFFVTQNNSDAQEVTLGDITLGTQFENLVTFTALATDGQTTIHGGNISAGTITLTGAETINGTLASTVVSGAASGATANQSDNAAILSGTHTGNVTGSIQGSPSSTVVNAALDPAARINAVATVIEGDKIKTGTITANQIDSASVIADIINGATITGSLIRTASTGKRVELSSGASVLTYYDTNGSTVLASLGSSGFGFGVIYGKSISGANQPAVTGNSLSVYPGVYGHSSSTGNAIDAISTSGSGHGVNSSASSGQGVYGKSTGNDGVRGETSSNSSKAGVWGKNTGSAGYGVFGEVTTDGANVYGGYFKSSAITNTNAAAVYAEGNGVQIKIGTNDWGVYVYNSSKDGTSTDNGPGYGPFTGGHDALMDIPEAATMELGDIVVDVEVVARSGVSDTITKVRRSSEPMQKAAVGVLSKTPKLLGNSYIPAGLIDGIVTEVDDDTLSINRANALRADIAAAKEKDSDFERDSFILYLEEKLGTEIAAEPIERNVLTSTAYETLKDNCVHLLMNSVGEGQVNVCGENGNIEIGDLICTSSMQGKGMRQSDDLVHNYTVAKAREAVTFTNPNEVKMIACIYMCG